MKAGTGELFGTRTIRQQQFVVADLPTVVQLHNMFRSVDSNNSPRYKTKTLFPVKRVRSCPQLFLTYTPCQIIFKRRPIVDRKGIIGDDSNRSYGVLSTQNLSCCHSSNAIADNQI